VIRFLHAADLHLDSPLRGLSRYEGAPAESLRSATRRALENLVQAAIDKQVNFVVIAGDLYDGDWKDYNTAQFLVRQMSRLDKAGIQVVAISGNHDAQSKLTRQLNLPPNVRTLSVTQPETVLLDAFDVAIHGQGFEHAEVTNDLSAHYPAPEKGRFNLGLLHTSADGREGHARYAPCSLDALKRHGYDYWALGHIHKREVLCDQPHIVFSGNIQGRHIREEGAKGVTLVTVDDGKVSQLEHLPVDVVRWARLSLDLADAADTDEVLGAVRARLDDAARRAGDRMLAARIELTGRSPVFTTLAADVERWTQEVRSLGNQSLSDVWIEKVRFLGSEVAPGEDSSERAEILTSLVQGIERLADQDSEIAGLGADLFAKLDSSLPREWKEDDDALALLSLDFLKETLAEVGPMLRARLRTGDSS
jgi:DNA repair exonuclease SbcCD nuclease subunit